MKLILGARWASIASLNKRKTYGTIQIKSFNAGGWQNIGQMGEKHR